MRRGEPHGGLVPGSGRRPEFHFQGGSGEGEQGGVVTQSVCDQRLCQSRARGERFPHIHADLGAKRGRRVQDLFFERGTRGVPESQGVPDSSLRSHAVPRVDHFSTPVAARGRPGCGAFGRQPMPTRCVDVVEKLVEIDRFFQDAGDPWTARRRSRPGLCEPVSISMRDRARWRRLLAAA